MVGAGLSYCAGAGAESLKGGGGVSALGSTGDTDRFWAVRTVRDGDAVEDKGDNSRRVSLFWYRHDGLGGNRVSAHCACGTGPERLALKLGGEVEWLCTEC